MNKSFEQRMYEVLKKLDNHFCFEANLLPNESFCEALGYKATKCKMINRVFTEASALIREYEIETGKEAA